MGQHWDTLGGSLSMGVGVALSVVVLLLGRKLWDEILLQCRCSKFPLLEVPFPTGTSNPFLYLERIYAEGYRRFKDQIYRINTPEGVRLIVPNRYLDELRLKADDEIDALRALRLLTEGKYLFTFPGGHQTRIMAGVCKKELTRNMARIHPSLCDQVTRTVAAEVPPCNDWTPVPIFSNLLRIVAVISGYVFVGPSLCRDEAYLKLAIGYTNDISIALPALKRWRRWLRWWASRVEPTVERVREARRQMTHLLAPIVAKRRLTKKEGGTLPDDLLQWMIDRADEVGVADVDLSNMQLLLTMAAIHTTTVTTTFIIHDLVSRPAAMKACRMEILEAVKASGGEMTLKALFNMKLLDSVMRESQRLNPLLVDAFYRYVRKDVTLSDGTVLPRGAMIQVANKAVLMDPELYPNPEIFDPYRFFRLRTDPTATDPIGLSNLEQYQFVSVTKENMNFGLGPHACPGRFFGANEVKMILAQLLLNFEFARPEGQDTKVELVALGVGSSPDPAREVMMKRL